MKIYRRAGLAAAATTSALLVLSACGGTAQPTEPATSKSAAQSSDSQSMATQQGGSHAGTADHGKGARAGDPFTLTREAASHMPMTADALAGGFDTALKLPGAVGSDAASLRAGLTYLLTEHVYLAGIAVDTAYVAGPESKEFEQAARALDENTVALGDAVGSIAGQDKRTTFLTAWRSHIDDFVSYAVAVKSDDASGKRQALKNLKAYERVAGEFFADLTGGALPADAVRASLGEHVQTLTEAIDAFAAGDGTGFDKLKDAAEHMPMTAEALATGIDEATDMRGSTTGQAADVRALLNAKLTEHVYLAGVAVFTAYTEGADSDAFAAAAATLDDNSVDLANAVTSLTDKQTGESFLAAWRSHIEDFVTYAVAVAEKDPRAQKDAQANLQAYAVQQGKTLQELTGGALPADAVQQEFEGHIASLTRAIDAMAASLL